MGPMRPIGLNESNSGQRRTKHEEPGSHMGTIGTRCCPGGTTTEPGEACTGTDFIPAHPSQPSRRQARINSGPFQIDTLTAGCTLNHSLTHDPAGRYPLSLEVVSSQPIWTALLVVWFDQPTNLDPHVIGALNSVQAGASVKLRDASGWPVTGRPGPWLIGGAVVEQGGQIYVAPQNVSGSTNLTRPNPCCWFGVGGGGTDSQDEPCRATRRAFRSDLSTPSEEVIGGSGRLSQDAFGVLQNDGTIDRDIRPDFNLGQTAHPVTRFGWCIGLTSCLTDVPDDDAGAEGTFTLKGQVGPICGTVLAHGAEPYTSGPATAPEPLGELVIDEPLDTVPAGWFPHGLYFDDDSDTSEASGPAAWSARDGSVFVESLFGGEYNGGTLSTTLPIARADWRDGSRLTIEWTHRRVRDADRRFPIPGTPDPAEYRDQSNGVFVGGLFRWLGRQQQATRLDETLAGGGINPAYGWIATGPVHPFGGQIKFDRSYAAWPTEWDYDTDEQPDLPDAIIWQLAGENAFDGRQDNCLLVAPNDGDRMTLTLDCAIVEQFNDYTLDVPDDKIDVWRWTVKSYLNGRLITPSTPVSDNSGVFFAPPPLTNLRIGLCAYRGGGWSDFKVWLHNPS